jgi:hypothetical protein
MSEQQTQDLDKTKKGQPQEPKPKGDSSMEPTDSERIDRLAQVMPRLVAARYNWRAATPFTLRCAIDLAWEELNEDAKRLRLARGRATDEARCGERCGTFWCVRRRGHGGAHRYKSAKDSLAGAPVPAVDPSWSTPDAVAVAAGAPRE